MIFKKMILYLFILKIIEFVQFSFSKFAQKGQHLGYRYEKLEIIN
jgi:hypothetical protein